MGPETVAVLRVAVEDPVVVARYHSHVQVRGPAECWLWTGAISGNGHGRFALGDAYLPGPDGERRRITFVAIAHRFGYALQHGVDALLRVPLLAHRCDNPLCQNPRCWRPSDHATNRREYLARRDGVLGPLADTRGARGRAREIRDAARAGVDIEAAGLTGAPAAHRAQLAMFPEPSRDYSDDATPLPADAPAALWWVGGGVSDSDGAGEGEQGELF